MESLHTAAASNNQCTLKRLIKEGADVNGQNFSGKTPLFIAAERGRADIVQLLITVCNADVNLKDSQNYTPLEIAIMNSHSDVVETILKSSISAQRSINVRGKRGLRPIVLAVNSSSASVVKILLDYGAYHTDPVSLIEIAKLVNPSAYKWLTLVHDMLIAANNNDVNKIRSYLREDVPINAKNSNGQTLLHLAVSNGNSGLVRLLLNNGARLNVISNEGFTPLHVSIMNRKYEITSQLIESAISKLEPVELVNFLDAQSEVDKDTALHLAARADQPELVKLLLRAGAIHDPRNEYGSTPSQLTGHKDYLDMATHLIVCAEKDKTEQALNILAQRPKLVNARDTLTGCTALHLAVARRNINLIDGLLNFGADVTLPSNSGQTTLHYACKMNSNDLVNLMIEWCPKASRTRFVNMRSFATGETPLHLTSDLRIAQTLKRNGALVDVINAKGMTPNVIDSVPAQIVQGIEGISQVIQCASVIAAMFASQWPK